MKKKIIAAVSAALLLISILCIVPSFAKYTTEQGEQSEINSTEFYFTSDYLSEGVIPEYKIYGDSVSFKISNYIDSLRVNESDIEYTVSTDAGALSSSGGTLTGGTDVSNTITLTYNREEAEKEITVTVRSSSPYVKELKAKFIFAESTLRYEIIDSAGSYYAELYIHTANEEKSVNLSWDKEKILIDETNDYVFGKLNESKDAVSISIAAHTTVKIVFFKNDITKNYYCDETTFADTINMTTAAGS